MLRTLEEELLDLKLASSHRALPTAAVFVLCASLFNCCRGFEDSFVDTFASNESAGQGGQPTDAGAAGVAPIAGGPDGAAEAGSGSSGHRPSGSGEESTSAGAGGERGVVGTGSYALTEKAFVRVQLGATKLMPFEHFATTCLLVYSPATGQVSFNYVKSGMAGLAQAWSHDHWAPGFVSFTPYYQGGVDYFVALNPGFNEVHFDGFPANLQGPDILLITAPKARFSHITSYQLSSVPYLLFYDILSGSAVVQTPVSGGAGANLEFMTVLDWGITDIASLQRSNDVHLLLFDAARRRVQYVLALEDHFESVASANFDDPLALSAAFADEQTPFFLIYGNDGRSVLYEFSFETFEPTVAWRGSLPAGATQIAAFKQAGELGFLLGDDASGWIRLYHVARVPS
jgi:hypothetical protein